MRVAVIGYGYWGPNLARNFAANSEAALVAVCDLAEKRLIAASRLYPAALLTDSIETVLNHPGIDLVAISTPISTHFEIAKRAMLAGKDVFVEKPLCTTAAEADELINIAREHDRKVFVDHTFVYNPAVIRMREAVRSTEFGKVLYYDSVRANLGLFQHDINVLWDLAPHDLSILDFILDGALPASVACVGSAHFGETENIAYLSLEYENGFIAHCHLNWLAPVKMRRITVGGSRQMLVYDDSQPAERIKIYDSGVALETLAAGDANTQRVQYRVGSVLSPFVSADEALANEVQHVIECYEGSAEPLTGIRAGSSVVRILEAAQRSMREGGKPQTISTAQFAGSS